MFRKAKKLSKRLGLNKDSCTAGSGFALNNNKDVAKCYVSDESLSEKQQNQHKQQPPPPPQFALNIDRVSTRGSTASDDLVDDDSTSSKSTESEELKLSPQARPVLGKCQTAPNAQNLYDTSPSTLQRQLSMMDTGNLDLLLSMETQARLEAQAEREKEEQQQLLVQNNMLAPRPTRIKFELPVTPPRSRSPARLTYPRARPVRSLPDEGLTTNTMRHSFPSSNNPKTRRTGWRHLFGDREEEEVKPTPIPITIGTKVRLKMRPLPTFGIVRYIGAVDFGRGEYIGIELDHGVGNCDGSINGARYFDTDPHRGTFAKRHELEAVAE
ncbi:hypothetical protein [Parasitella parasitica]|uniref:CAP-Gly domain-containing protein n=1 Tax=Parasitella parasitica TaxID=35722 RepID=A0A0B7MYV0_9FUNG|nr:hypothetical protein [Parasitella parasitica]